MACELWWAKVPVKHDGVVQSHDEPLRLVGVMETQQISNLYDMGSNPIQDSRKTFAPLV